LVIRSPEALKPETIRAFGCQWVRGTGPQAV